jgi:hypothetical protein
VRLEPGNEAWYVTMLGRNANGSTKTGMIYLCTLRTLLVGREILFWITLPDTHFFHSDDDKQFKVTIMTR